MYKHSSSSENRDLDLNQELASIDSTQERVYSSSTLEPACCSAAQKPITVDSLQNPVSMDTTQNKVRSNTLPPSPVTQPYDLTDSTQIPVTQTSTKDTCSPLVKQDLESYLTAQTIEKDLKISLSTLPSNLSLPSQAINQESTTLITHNPELTTLSSCQPAQSNIVMCDSSQADDTKDTIMEDIRLPNKVDEKDASSQIAKRGRKNVPLAPEIITREPRKRRSTANVNYREQTDFDVIFAEEPVEEKSIEEHIEEKSAKKKPAEKKNTEKKPTGKKMVEKKTVGKKTAVKKPAGKKSTGKKSTGKKSTGKRLAERELEEELAEDPAEEEPAQIQGKKPKRQRKSVIKSESNKESGSGIAIMKERKRVHHDNEEEEEEAVDMPRKKVTRIRTKEAIRKEAEEKEKEEKQMEDEEEKINRLLQSKTSFLTEINMREMIPQWLEALPEEDKLELALLLPDPDCEVKEGEQPTIREGFGANSSQLHDAADQWQSFLVLGGFDKSDHQLEAQVLTDPFKDENYERNWGERICRDQNVKPKGRGRPKKNT